MRNDEVLSWLDGQHEAMIELLRDAVNIDSGSYNKAGVDAVGKVFEDYLARTGIACERVPDDTFGDCIRAVVSGAGRGDNRPVVLMATVTPFSPTAPRPSARSASRATAPTGRASPT
jgi:glutamate carboxypeptidase